jgi:hypothetical protein
MLVGNPLDDARPKELVIEETEDLFLASGVSLSESPGGALTSAEADARKTPIAIEIAAAVFSVKPFIRRDSSRAGALHAWRKRQRSLTQW